MPSRFIGVVVIGVVIGLFAQPASRAQESPPGKPKRAVYFVKHGDATALATVLAKHFKDDAEVQAVPGENYLLVRGPAAAVEEVTKLLATLDRRPRLVSVELFLIEASAKADGKGLDDKGFTGPEKAVLDRVAELRKKGLLGESQRFQFTAIEGSPVTILIGTSKAFTTGVSGFRGKGGLPGPVTRSVSYRDLGTQAKLTAHVGDGKGVVLDLDLSESRMATPTDGAVIGQDEKGAAIHAPEFIRTTLKGKLIVPPGQAVAAKDVLTESKSGQARTLILAIARVVEPAAGGK